MPVDGGTALWGAGDKELCSVKPFHGCAGTLSVCCESTIMRSAAVDF